MKIIITGAGYTGNFIAKYLSSEGIDITVIDPNTDMVRDITDIESVAGVVGEGTSLEALNNADIKNADIFIAISSSDEVNILSCCIAQAYNVQLKMARIKDPKYITDDWQELYSLGKISVDQIISPNIDMFKSIQRKINYNYLNISDIFSFSTNHIKIVSLFCSEESLAISKTIAILQEIIMDSGEYMKIVGIFRNNTFFIPNSEDFIQEADKVFVATTEDAIEDVFSLFYSLENSESKFLESRRRSIIVCGDSALVTNLAITLSQSYPSVKVVTSLKEDSVKDLATQLEAYKVQLITDDITKEEYRHNYISSKDDIIIMLNNKDEDSVLNTLLLQNQGMTNVFCCLNNNTYERFLLKNGVNHILIPDNHIMSSVLVNIRRGVILNVYTLYNQAEVIELEVAETSNAIGKKISDVEKESSIKVCGLLDEKEENIINFTPETILKSGYRIIYVVLRSGIKISEGMFSQNLDLNR